MNAYMINKFNTNKSSRVYFYRCLRSGEPEADFSGLLIQSPDNTFKYLIEPMTYWPDKFLNPFFNRF